MRARRSKRFLTLVLPGLLALQMSREASAQTSPKITYQGRLVDQGSPANGSYDFEVKLFEDSAGMSQVGITVLVNDVAVVNGLFMLQLDFDYLWPGYTHYLQISVRKGDEAGSYTPLLPRQEVAAAPQALFAESAGRSISAETVPLAGISGLPAGGLGATHNHLGQSWSGAGPGLNVSSSSTGAVALQGTVIASGTGVVGRVTAETVDPFSTGVLGENNGRNDTGLGVHGRHLGGGIGVLASSAEGIGLLGNTQSTSGAGVKAAGPTKNLSATPGTALEIESGAITVQGGSSLLHDPPVFVHVATTGAGGNVTDNYTCISHLQTNADPNAMLIVTSNWNPGNRPAGVYNDHPIGVFYESSSQKWCIFNQDSAAVPNQAAFNVLVVKQR
jgi:hypothetical protein